MLMPNTPCKIYKAGEPDQYGKRTTVGGPLSEFCAITKLRHEIASTTVRADSGASRGHAEEFVNNNRVLLVNHTEAAPGDKLIVLGFELRITHLQPRLDAFGRLDHYEVQGDVWG